MRREKMEGWRVGEARNYVGRRWGEDEAAVSKDLERSAANVVRARYRLVSFDFTHHFFIFAHHE